MLEPGDRLPDLTLPDQDGRPVALADLRGRWLVLFCYPKAGTSGCTTQVCGVRDHAADYAARDARVVGLSPDPVDRVAAFSEAQSAGFTLLADADHAACEALGVWQAKSMYGRTYMGVVRTTFLVDPEGVVRDVLPKVQPKQHDRRVLAGLDALRTD